MIKAISAIIHDNATPAQAEEIYKEEKASGIRACSPAKKR
jgi:hypothetical protein